MPGVSLTELELAVWSYLELPGVALDYLELTGVSYISCMELPGVSWN